MKTLALTLVLAVFALVPTASAQSDRDAEAHVMFEAGRIAFNDGHYEDAYERFAEAYRLSERPELLYNMASSADRLRRDQLALDHYRAFLAAVPDTPHRLDVEHRIAILDGALAAHTPAPAVDAPPPTSAPAVDSAPRDAPVWEQWWLWTIIGVAVVGLGVGIGVGVGTSGSSNAPPVPGDVGAGGVVMTLVSF